MVYLNKKEKAMELYNETVGMTFNEAYASMAGAKYKIAKKWSWTVNEDLSFEDLTSYADEGILYAYKTYDSEKGSLFSTYAYNNINWAIQNNLRTSSKIFKQYGGDIKVYNESRFQSDDSDNFNIMDTITDQVLEYALDYEIMHLDVEKIDRSTKMGEKSYLAASMLLDGAEIAEVAKALKVTKVNLFKMFDAKEQKQKQKRLTRI